MVNDDFLYNFRNKEYGAYKIRKLYKKTVLISLLFSSISIVILFAIPLFLSFKNQFKDDLVFKRMIVPAELSQLEKIEQPKHEVIKPLKSKVPEILALKTHSGSEVKTDSSKNKRTIAAAIEKDSTKKSLETNLKKEDERLKSEAIFSCEGDMLKFRNWFYQNFKFPDSLKSKKIEGKLLIQFTIDTRGLVDSVSIMTSVYPTIDNIAKQTILNAPRWVPCIIDGKKVKQLYIFPIYILARK